MVHIPVHIYFETEILKNVYALNVINFIVSKSMFIVKYVALPNK